MDVLYAFLVSPAVPFIGNLLLRLPFVANKLVPWINTAIAIAVKYAFLWERLGFGQIPPPPATDVEPTMALAGWGWGWLADVGKHVVPIVWGCVEGLISKRLYDWRRDVVGEPVSNATNPIDKVLLGGKSSWF